MNPLMNRDHRQLDVLYISTLIKPLMSAELSNSVAAIQVALGHTISSYSCTYRKARLTKHREIADLFNDWVTSYSMLAPYMDALCRENPGAVVLWHFEDGPLTNTNQFHRVFWSFGPSMETSHSYRPVINIHGTHIYGKYLDPILVAVGVDVNDQLFPLAFAILEGEINDSWG